MRVGTINYATDQGLGILVKSFYDHGILTDVLPLTNGPRRLAHPEWYPNSIPPAGYNRQVALQFIREMNVMFFFETPFDWELIPICKDWGIKTVLMPMHECMPKQLPYEPDLFICPSLLDLDCYPKNRQRKSLFLPVPVEVPWRERNEATIFVHNSGHGGLRGRNGTAELIDAMPYVKSPIQLILRTQDNVSFPNLDSRITHQVGTIPYEDLWTEGDVFVFPEKFNGLSLPLQEAHAAGMLIMCGNRFPMNTWLPTEPLIPVESYSQSSVGQRYAFFQEAKLNPKDIAKTIDSWYGKNIREFSIAGKEFAETASWDYLKSKYDKALYELQLES